MENRLTYSDKLKNPKWQKKRLDIFKRDKWTCQRCHNTEKTLVVHHKVYLTGKEPWDYPNYLLITLCEKCHNKEIELIPLVTDELIKSIKSTGLCLDISYLVEGFNYIAQKSNSKEMINVISWVLDNEEILKYLKQKHAKYWKAEMKKIGPPPSRG